MLRLVDAELVQFQGVEFARLEGLTVGCLSRLLLEAPQSGLLGLHYYQPPRDHDILDKAVTYPKILEGIKLSCLWKWRLPS